LGSEYIATRHHGQANGDNEQFGSKGVLIMSRVAGIGHVLAPWPFLIFGFIALAGGAAAWPALGGARGVMVAFDAAACAFLISCGPLFRHGPREMRQSAQRNDANRGFLLLIAAVVTGVIMVAVGIELAHKGRPQPMDVMLVVCTLFFSWLFSTLVYALHYAHVFYTRSPQGQDSGGLCFPGTEDPNYWDFAYFSSCLAMTFQTSDVDIKSGTYRRTVIFHTLGAFVFNIGVIAFSINILSNS
jgi:uncharacterized membrane protein